MKIKLPLKKVLVSASVLMTAFAGAMFTEAKAQAIDEIVVTSQKRAAGIISSRYSNKCHSSEC